MMSCLSTSEQLSCTLCSLHETRTQVVPGHGDVDARIAYVGEAPGEVEDRKGRPFVGRAGELLDTLTIEAGIDPASVFKANVLCCRPPRNAIRECPDAVSRCPDLWLKPTLQGLVNLRVVVALGATAAALWFPGKKAGEIARLARMSDVSIVGSYHPAYALREGQWVSDSIIGSLSRALVYSGLER